MTERLALDRYLLAAVQAPVMMMSQWRQEAATACAQIVKAA